MRTPTRILLVGAGRKGIGHFNTLKAMPALAEVVAAVDPSEAARKQAREAHGIAETYSDLSDALAAVAADAAVISVPNFLHADYTAACLNAGLHVFIEKPIALHMPDIDRMIETADKAGRLVMAGQSQRFSATTRYVKWLIDSGEIGQVRHMLHHRLGASSGRGGDEHSWFAKQAKSGGILPGIGSHSIDVLMWWIGEAPTSTYAQVRRLDPHPEIDIEDDVSLVATTTSGAIINVALSWHLPAGTQWIVGGSKGVIRFDGARDGKIFVNGAEREVPASVPLAGESELLREFLCAIREGRPLAHCSARDVKHAYAVVFAAQESGRTGMPVAL
ncbi:MAG: Gfo/Idh/MocA family oxidoreductase [Kiritimatiellae bacterium]|nr:Gfo/Idh/MocA family oxidoreductase [Kiritimatiellia bacterium]